MGSGFWPELFADLELEGADCGCAGDHDAHVGFDGGPVADWQVIPGYIVGVSKLDEVFEAEDADNCDTVNSFSTLVCEKRAEETHKPPPRNMTITPNFRCQLMLRMVNCFMGRAMTIKSRMMLSDADAQPSAFKSRHFPLCSPSHFFQAIDTGIHCRAVTVTKTTLYKPQIAIMA